MSTLTVGGPGGVPWRTKRGLGAGANFFIRITSPQHEYVWLTCQQSCIPASGPLPGHTRRPCTQASAPHRTSTPTSPSHLTMEHPFKADSHISMAAEVRELLSRAMLDTSSQASGDSTLKRPTSVVLGVPPSARVEDSFKPVATSFQASPWVIMPDDTEPINQTPEVVCTPTTPPTKTPGTDMGVLPKEVILLQEEMNRTMRYLLMTRSSLDTHWREQVSDFETALHQNKAKATEAIREAKSLCGTAIREADAHHATHIREAEAYCTTHIREAEAHCATTIMEVEAHCATDIREAEPLCASCPLHPTVTCRRYAASRDRNHGRGGERQPLLPNHLWSSTASQSPEACGVLMYPIQLSMGNMSLATLLAIPLWYLPPGRNLPLWFPIQLLLWHPCPPWGPNNDTICPTRWHPHHSQEMKLWDFWRATHLKQKDKMPFKKSLKGDQWEAFAKDSDLVWQAREDYFRTNCPHFDHETLHDLSGVFMEMIMSVGLPDSKFTKSKRPGPGKKDLWYANDALKTLLKGLRFFHPISPSELPKVMDLEGIHHPDALHHFAGVTFCPWCGKEGPNEGTIVN